MKRGLNNNVTIFIVLSIAFVSLGVIISLTEGPFTPTGKVIFDGTCGEISDSQILTKNTTLDGSCTYNLPNGITIGANEITLDCNGATLKGSLSFDSSENKTCSSGTGITLTNIRKSRVLNCNVIDYDSGIYINGFSKENNLSNNVLSNIDDYGFYMENPSNESLFYGNTLENNGNCGNLGNGIYVKESKENIFEKNIIRNTPKGFVISGVGNVDENILKGNTIEQSSSAGISITNSKENLITENLIKNNKEGILINSISKGSESKIINNNIINNTNFGLTNGLGDLNASDNWWGTTDKSIISSLIFDFFDNKSLGIVTYNPFLTSFFGSCTPNWITNSTWQTCQKGDIQYTNYIDANFCGVSNSNIANQSCDFDGDGFIGDISNVNTTLKLNLTVENNTVTFDEDNSTLLEFEINLSGDSTITLEDVFIEKQPSSSSVSYIIVKGIDLNSKGKTKSVYVDKILNSNIICLKDAEINSVNEISSSCDGQNEVYLTCPGTEGSYSCEIVGNKLKVSGLKNSGVTEISCVEDWSCNAWGSCQSGLRTRSCTDSHSCGTEVSIPDEVESCDDDGAIVDEGNAKGGAGGGGAGGSPSRSSASESSREILAGSNESNSTENEITAGASVDIDSGKLFSWIKTSGNLSKTANLTMIISLSVIIFGIGGYSVYRKNKKRINSLFRGEKKDNTPPKRENNF